MNLFNLMKIALRAIWSNKFRSFLSMLGIIIGVAAVIIMMSIGQGSKESVRKNISKMGTNLIMVRPGADRRGGVRQDPSAMQTLKVEDYEKILAQKSYISHVSPEVTASGQAINELFGENVDPSGKNIRFKSIPFRIVGVLKALGYNSWGMDQDNGIIAPYTSVMKRVLAQTYLSSINCSALKEEMTDNAIEEVTQILRTNHKIASGAEDDFTIRSQEEMMSTMSSTMDTITIILVVAAAFSLLVAGIGIMNIMLVSVTERTKEIGLRMSVGARGLDISNQFLLESILISMTGGLLGLLVGYLGTLLCSFFHLPTSIPLWSILVSFAVCTIIGVLFGYFPAKKAANMDPIEAIRYE